VGEYNVSKDDLIPVRTKEEAKERGRNGGIASGKARREKKNMRETAKMLLGMSVNPTIDNTLEQFGIEKNDRNYQTAVVVRLLQRACADGDTAAIRLLGELTGDVNKFSFGAVDDSDFGDVLYPTINIPNNGRDRNDSFSLAPQAGPQTMFMTSPADIVVYGGAAGGGKTYALLLEVLRNKDVKNFGAVIFRHNYNQVTAEGGLWDASHKIFSQVPGASSRKSPKLSWRFDNGAKLSFAHLERDEDLQSWQGTEIAYIAFDELTHFTRKQFLYMLSRNRSTCGIRPYIRATCNPDADSWVADFISWWIDQDTGYPMPERSGRIRWMCVLNDVIYWGDSPEELVEKYGIEPDKCKSVTFIASRLEDNKILMEKDPGYMANLQALTEVDMERLLKGNWKIKASAGRYFKRIQVNLIEEIPDDIIMWCRAWDLAATSEDENGDADYTSGVLMGRRKNGTIVILDVINQRMKAGDVEKLVYNTSVMDRNKYGYQYVVRVPQDPGQAGKVLAGQYVKLLSGFNIKTLPVSGSKETRATPLAAQWQNGNIEVLLGEWNDMYFSQLESFPESKHDDMVDASSDAFSELTSNTFDIDSLL
jgi:predicted phage terminase large subunit-like protein